MKENDEIQSRREFFKNAAKKALPILGAIAMINSPVLVRAMEEQPLTESPMGCNRESPCTGSCYQGCGSTCKGSCRGDCTGRCTNTCKGSCSGKCTEDCRSTCSYTCIGSCRKSCLESCRESCKGSNYYL